MDRSIQNGGSNLGEITNLTPATAFTNLPNGMDGAVSPANAEFGTNNFAHGMHSFHSASELQYYLDRMAGPGARATITDAMHFRIVPNSSAQGAVQERLPQQGVGGLVFGNRSALGPSVNPLLQLLPRSGSSGPVAGASGGDGLVGILSGESRTKSIVLFCELHGTSNAESGQIMANANGGASTANASTASASTANASTANANSHFPNNAIHFGYCQICQAWMLGSGNRNLTFPSSNP